MCEIHVGVFVFVRWRECMFTDWTFHLYSPLQDLGVSAGPSKNEMTGLTVRLNIHVTMK